MNIKTYHTITSIKVKKRIEEHVDLALLSSLNILTQNQNNSSLTTSASPSIAHRSETFQYSSYQL